MTEQVHHEQEQVEQVEQCHFSSYLCSSENKHRSNVLFGNEEGRRKRGDLEMAPFPPLEELSREGEAVQKIRKK